MPKIASGTQCSTRSYLCGALPIITVSRPSIDFAGVSDPGNETIPENPPDFPRGGAMKSDHRPWLESEPPELIGVPSGRLPMNRTAPLGRTSNIPRPKLSRIGGLDFSIAPGRNSAVYRPACAAGLLSAENQERSAKKSATMPPTEIVPFIRLVPLERVINFPCK